MPPFAKRLIYKGASYTLYDVYTSRAKAVAEAEYLETTQHADVVVQPRGSSFGVYAFVRRRPIRNPKKRIKKNPALMVIGNPQKNPKVELMSDSVLEVRYIHRDDGEPYKHTFKRGVRMQANEDGTITMYHPTKRIHEEFPS